MGRSAKVVIAAAAVIALVAAGATWWFLRDDAPEEVTLERAAGSVDEGAGDGSGDPGDGASSIDGTWTVDAESGDFDYEQATGTFVGFRITEELVRIGQTEAVGRTGDVTGSATIDGTTLTEASFEADLTSITTNESRRDDRVQQALETDQHPTATFELTEPVELGEDAAEGGSVAVTATGDLTVHGVTRSVEIPLEAELVDDTVIVVGSLDITFADYGVEVPSAPVVVSVEDEGVVELQLLLTRD